MITLLKKTLLVSFFVQGFLAAEAPIIELGILRYAGAMATEPSTREHARDAAKNAGLNISNELNNHEVVFSATTGWERKLNKNSGEGFWDITLTLNLIALTGSPVPANTHRIVCYGPGEYVQPHYHNRDEKFAIKSGGCYVWISTDNGATWHYNYCNGAELAIPANSWHCLIASKNGLCMDIWNDSGRSIDWCDTKQSKQWAPDLEFPVSIADLRAATNTFIDSIVYEWRLEFSPTEMNL